jgi:uncharacterized protein YmfQ (DUF2313 family)
MSELTPRTRETFAHAFMALLPEGPIWPREIGSRLYRTVLGLMGIVERWALDAWSFLTIEAFPPTSSGLLPDWERVLGLPEPCFPVAQTLAERRIAVREKLARRPGGQSRAYFIGLAERLGYHEPGPSPYQLPFQLPGQVGILRQVRIREYRPFMAGVSRCADPTWQIGHQTIRFYWRITVPDVRATWFRAGGGGGRAGVDPHVKLRRADDLECVFRIFQPAHTHCIFSYQGV